MWGNLRQLVLEPFETFLEADLLVHRAHADHERVASDLFNELFAVWCLFSKTKSLDEFFLGN